MILRLRSGQAPQLCFRTNEALEEAARLAERRKHQAIDRLNERLAAQPPEAKRQAGNVEPARQENQP